MVEFLETKYWDEFVDDFGSIYMEWVDLVIYLVEEQIRLGWVEYGNMSQCNFGKSKIQRI